MRNTLNRARLHILLPALVASLTLALAACGGGGGDSAGGPSASPPSAATATQGHGPGTVAITSSAISGQAGKVLLVFATPAGGGQQVAVACTQITSDSFELPATVMTEVPAGNNPCEGGTGEATFDEGTYSLVAGVYVGGQQTPEAQATVNVTVAGDVTAEIDGAELSQ